MDLGEIKEHVRTLTGVRMDTLLPESQLEADVNEAYHGIAAMAPWSFRYGEGDLTLAAGTSVYALPVGVDLPETLAFPAGGGVLFRRTADQLDRQPSHRRAPGTPWAWATTSDGTVELFPEPDAVVTVKVRGRKDLPDLGGADSPAFAPEFHPVVSYAAAVAILEREGDDSGRTERFQAEVQSYLGRMAARYLPDGGPVAGLPQKGDE